MHVKCNGKKKQKQFLFLFHIVANHPQVLSTQKMHAGTPGHVISGGGSTAAGMYRVASTTVSNTPSTTQAQRLANTVSSLQVFPFYPTALNGCWGIVFTHGFQLGRRLACIIRCRKLIGSRDVGWG